MRLATLIVLASFVLAAGAMADDKWPSDYVPGTPDPQGLVGGDTVDDALVIGTLPYSDTGNTCTFADDYDEVCPYTGSVSPDVVYAYTPSGDGLVDIDLCVGSTYDTKLYVYEDTVTPGAPFACNDDECPGFVSQLIGLQLTIGHSYYIVIDGYGGDCGDYTFDMSGDLGGVPVDASTWGSVKNIYR